MFLHFLIFLNFWASAVNPPDKAHTLIIHIQGIKPQKADILVALHDKASSFSSDPKSALALRKVNVKEGAQSATLTFKNLPEGDYAVQVLQDQNGNKKMDFGRLGAPKEGFGVSNPPKSKFKKPDFNESRFRLMSDPTHITIRMVYF